MSTTTTARIEFHCYKSANKLKYTHSIPSALLTPKDQIQDEEWIQTFIQTLEPICKEHEEACKEESLPTCQECQEPMAKVIQTPMSWLHVVGDPFVNVWVNPVCGKEACEELVRQGIQDTMNLISQGKEPEEEELDQYEGILEVGGDGFVNEDDAYESCRVCGKVEGSKRCGGCREVSYCGREHQKEDWRAHKSLCRASA